MDFDFEIPSNDPEMTFDGLLTESWLPRSACESASAQDPFQQYFPNLCNQCRHDTKLNQWHHLNWTLLSPIESYQASVPVQQLSASDKLK